MTRVVLIVFIHVLCCCGIALSESVQRLSLDSQSPASQIAPIRVDHFGPGTWPISGPNKGGEPCDVLQDPVNFDVLALIDDGGEVVEQYSSGGWEPYGTVLVCETHGSRPPPIGKVGHHGLFFDRLDMPAVIGGYMNYPTFESDAFLLGHVRNRAYLPSLGRWAQRDPNATGQVLATAMRGSVMFPVGVGLNAMYGDGMSLYGYLRSRPVLATDPHGLWTLGEVAGSMGIQGLLIGGLMGGLSGGLAGWQDGSGFWSGFASGAAIGAATGGAGMWGMGLASGLGPTAAGLFGGSLAGIAGSATSQLSHGDRISIERAYIDQVSTALMWQGMGGTTGGREDAFFASAFANSRPQMTSTAASTRITLAGRGSTISSAHGTFGPRTIQEQMFIRETLSNPRLGKHLAEITMSDPRWPASSGWIKMQRVGTLSDGRTANVHYVLNTRTGAVDDPKFKYIEAGSK